MVQVQRQGVGRVLQGGGGECREGSRGRLSPGACTRQRQAGGGGAGSLRACPPGAAGRAPATPGLQTQSPRFWPRLLLATGRP